MKCPMCGEDAPNIIVSESFECEDCSKINIFSYHLCTSCRIIWRAFNGVLIQNSIILLDDVENDPMLAGFGDRLLDSLKKTFLKSSSFVDNNVSHKTMSEFIHKCLRCNSIAIQISETCFRCTVCDFEWECPNGG